MSLGVPPRRQTKATTRREQLLEAAAELFAERGFHGVTIENLGEAVGISGPGIYKHFTNKDAVLSEMLIGISQYLLEGGEREIASANSPSEALERLLAFHTEFALTSQNLIRVHDRDLANLSPTEGRKVRSLQRAYVELWVGVLTEIDPSLRPEDARTEAHAVFGLLNSTSHSVTTRGAGAGAGEILQRMARLALAK